MKICFFGARKHDHGGVSARVWCFWHGLGWVCCNVQKNRLRLIQGVQEDDYLIDEYGSREISLFSKKSFR